LHHTVIVVSSAVVEEKEKENVLQLKNLFWQVICKTYFSCILESWLWKFYFGKLVQEILSQKNCSEYILEILFCNFVQEIHFENSIHENLIPEILSQKSYFENFGKLVLKNF